MTLDFVEFYMTEALTYGNSTTLVNMIANPVDRRVTLHINTFLDLLKSKPELAYKLKK